MLLMLGNKYWIIRNIHFLDVNQYHPNLEDKKQPVLDEYCINSSLYREMRNNHPLLDDYCFSTPFLDENVRSINIQKWEQNIPC